VAKGWWQMSYEEREASRPRARLKAKLQSVLRVSEGECSEIVSLLEEMMQEVRNDLRDEINKSGEYDPDY
jgi:hypothetical protein